MGLISTICVLLFCTIQNIFCEGNDTLVQVQQGWLRGEVLYSIFENTPYYSFKGIPYAKAPTGELRFKAPQDPESWDGVRNATVHGSVCPQYNPISGTYTHGSEDCLFLNVYTLNTTCSEAKPVIVFIHGGAYMFGSGDSDLYGPDHLVTKEVVVVTINYRLGPLGFLSMGTKEVPGNAGLKDQVAALKWVKSNINVFGGNPDDVTLMGDTAGSASVTLHLLSPMSKGLFKKAIATSGTPTCDYGLTYKPEERARVLGQLLGFQTKNTTELLTFLQSADYDLFFNVTPTVMASEEKRDVLFKMEDFVPVNENNFGDNFLTEDPNELLKNGNVTIDVDIMIGCGGQEAVLLIDIYNASYISLYNRYPEMFVPVEILTKCTPDIIMNAAEKIIAYYFGNKSVSTDNIQLFVKYASSASIAYHVQRFANKLAEIGNNIFFFIFNYFSSLNIYGQQGTAYGIEQAAHFDIVFYLFNAVSMNWNISTDSIEYEMIQNITTSVTNFAKYGNPSLCDVTWPQYNTSSKAYMNLVDNAMTVAYEPEDDYIFWKSIFDDTGVSF